MIEFKVDPSSAGEVDEYLDATRDRIFAAARQGMQEGFEDLAVAVIDQLPASHITSRTGLLQQAILRGVRVFENSDVLSGSLYPDTHDRRNLALWLEEGIDEPAVADKLMVFDSARGGRAFITRHQAFSVVGKPFLDPAWQKSKGPIFELIAQRVANAVAE